MSVVFRALVLWLTLACAWAAPLERDLGEGLRLYRIRELPADLPPAPSETGRAPACVVDIRYVKADADAAVAFQAWLRFRAKPRSPVFVLANAETARGLLEALAQRERGSGIVVVGVPLPGLEPDSAVRTNAEDERRAYAAVEQGASIDSVLRENRDKMRNDEASLSRDPLAEASAEETDDANETEPPPIDAALQRAVHLHRALLALKKI